MILKPGSYCNNLYFLFLKSERNIIDTVVRPEKIFKVKSQNYIDLVLYVKYLHDLLETSPNIILIF